jgi:hypothetical protein
MGNVGNHITFTATNWAFKQAFEALGGVSGTT